jgi:hypothetical protein
MQAIVSPPPPDSLQTAHSPVAPANLPDQPCCAVGRIIVDENHLPVHRVEHRIQQLDEQQNIVPFARGRGIAP